VVYLHLLWFNLLCNKINYSLTHIHSRESVPALIHHTSHIVCMVR